MQNEQIADTISGRATGVLFFAGFGSLWLCTGLYALHRLDLVTGAPIAVVGLSLVIPALHLLRVAGQNSGANSDTQEQSQLKRTFNRINAIQWIALVAAIIILNIAGKPAFIVPAIATIVGLHLFPLARLFQYPPHHVTGTLLVIWSLAVSAMLLPDQIASFGALGTAVILELSAAYTLTGASLPPEECRDRPEVPARLSRDICSARRSAQKLC